jgi:hypothetical protein
MNSIMVSIGNICNILFDALYNNIKMCINPNMEYEEELDIEFHGINTKRMV